MTRILRSLFGIGVSALMAALVASCSDATAPAQQKTTDELHFIRFAANAPRIQDTVVTFYAKLGENREIRLRYAPVAGSTETEEFLRFEVPGNALDRRPDGTSFAQGDSILITVRLANLTELVFDFQPSGLLFSADHPARLRIEFSHFDNDLDGDGDHDATDLALLATAGIWKQEAANQPWMRLADVLKLETDEVEADILGFTGYAFAY